MSAAELETIRLTFVVALTAVAVSLPPAIAAGWLLAQRRVPLKFALETLVNLPLVMPPVVTGYLLLVLFGRHGLLGGWLEAGLGVRFIFDWKGAALASAVVSFPLLVRPIRQAFLAVDEKLLLAARTLGATRWSAFTSIALPLAAPGILSGSVLAFARGMGEFGATIMIAGNIPGQTRTIPLHVYSELESPGGLAAAWPLIGVSIALATLALLGGELLERYGRRRILGAGA
jgi:molybdate transport system permease protein